MRLLYSVAVMTVCWLTCSSKALPFMPASDLTAVVNTVFKNDVGPALNICDHKEIVKSAPYLEFRCPHNGSEEIEKFKHSVEELLADYLKGRQSRQAQVGYNNNSFGLRFGKRESEINLDTV